jgi:peptidoglycan/xylan/chitin deacetylase (PgdA/CDA1 family)
MNTCAESDPELMGARDCFRSRRWKCNAAWLAVLLAGFDFLRAPSAASPVGIDRLGRTQGGIIRGALNQKTLSLVFTGHEFAESTPQILSELKKHKAKGSFFLTGDFLRNPAHAPLIRRIVAEGHYLGPHSDKHMLYCSWDKPFPPLVTHSEFVSDLESNIAEICRFHVQRKDIRYFLPAYEHFNQQIADWTAERGLRLVNYTPGTRSNADYTGEADKNFVPASAIYQSILSCEKKDPHHLNGFILLLHAGAGPAREDKFVSLFGNLLNHLQQEKYRLVRIDKLLAE